MKIDADDDAELKKRKKQGMKESESGWGAFYSYFWNLSNL